MYKLGEITTKQYWLDTLFTIWDCLSCIKWLQMGWIWTHDDSASYQFWLQFYNKEFGFWKLGHGLFKCTFSKKKNWFLGEKKVYR